MRGAGLWLHRAAEKLFPAGTEKSLLPPLWDPIHHHAQSMQQGTLGSVGGKQSGNQVVCIAVTRNNTFVSLALTTFSQYPWTSRAPKQQKPSALQKVFKWNVFVSICLMKTWQNCWYLKIQMCTDTCSWEGSGTAHACTYAHVFHVCKICICKGQAQWHYPVGLQKVQMREQNHCVTHQPQVTSARGLPWELK